MDGMVATRAARGSARARAPKLRVAPRLFRRRIRKRLPFMLLAPILASAAALLSPPVTAPATAVAATTAQGSTLTAADTAPDSGEDRLVITLRGTDSTDQTFSPSQVDRVPLWPNESVFVDNTAFSKDLTSAEVTVGGA